MKNPVFERKVDTHDTLTVRNLHAATCTNSQGTSVVKRAARMCMRLKANIWYIRSRSESEHFSKFRQYKSMQNHEVLLLIIINTR
jgi:hypothetical protein